MRCAECFDHLETLGNLVVRNASKQLSLLIYAFSTTLVSCAPESYRHILDLVLQGYYIIIHLGPCNVNVTWDETASWDEAGSSYHD